MELILVEENKDNIMRSVLQTFFSITETNELIDTLNLDLADESELYTINFGNEIIGFIILSPIAEINNPLINFVLKIDYSLSPACSPAGGLCPFQVV